MLRRHLCDCGIESFSAKKTTEVTSNLLEVVGKAQSITVDWTLRGMQFPEESEIDEAEHDDFCFPVYEINELN